MDAIEKIGIQIEKKWSFASIGGLQERYLSTLVAPLDTFWLHTMIRYSDVSLIRVGNKAIGYFCIGQSLNLIQYFVAAPYLKYSPAIFAELLHSDRVKSAMVSTVDPNLLALCLDYQTAVSVCHYQYFGKEKPVASLSSASGPVLRLATLEDDLDSITQAIVGSGAFNDFEIENSYETQKRHLVAMVDRQELYLAFEGGHFMAYGKIQPVRLNFHFGSLGLTLLKEFQGQGIGNDLFTQLEAYCREQKLLPVLSTSIDNRAAQRIAEKNGFVREHRVLKIQFSPS